MLAFFSSQESIYTRGTLDMYLKLAIRFFSNQMSRICLNWFLQASVLPSVLLFSGCITWHTVQKHRCSLSVLTKILFRPILEIISKRKCNNNKKVCNIYLLLASLQGEFKTNYSKYLFIFWLHWVFVAVLGLSHCCGERGLLLDAPCKFWSTGTVVVERRLRCSVGCEILLDQRWNPSPLHWQMDS